MARKTRALFLKWALLNALAVVFLVGLGVKYGGRIHGPSLVVIPIILFVWGLGTKCAGSIAWRADGDHVDETPVRLRLLHESRYIRHWAEQAQYIAMLATVFGIWSLLTEKGGNLHDRLISGGGVAFAATFLGIFASVVLIQSQRMIEHDLEG